MRTSPRGRELIELREDRRNEAYLDSRGRPTIGVGHTGPEVYLGLYWTNDQVDTAFEEDVLRFEAAVDASVTVPLNQDQYDALVSFSVNCGEWALRCGDHGGPCSILRALNARDYGGAAAAFRNWCNPPEVTSRRMGEMHQFMGDAFVARWPS